MLKLGTQNISSLYVGEQKIKKAFVGAELAFEDNPTYTVYFYAIEGTDTSKILNSSSWTVTPGESVTVYPWTINGYIFEGWYEGDALLSSATGAFVYTPEKPVTTIYLRYAVAYKLTINIGSDIVGVSVLLNGTGVPNPQLSRTYTFKPGTQITLEGKDFPSGWQFSHWYNDFTSFSYTNPWTFTMPSKNVGISLEGKKASRLPAGYTELEYVQSSNTTTVSSASSIVFPSVANAAACYCKFSINSNLVTSNTVTSEFMLFGYQYRNASNLCQLYSLALYNSNIVMWQRYYKSSNVVRSPVTLAPQALNTIYEFYSNSSTQKTTLNGDVVSGYIYPTFYGKGTSHVCNVLFGQCYTSGTDVSNTAVKGIRIYEFKMMDENDGVLLHLIPCKDPSGKIGMYDIIGKAFYANAKGTFHSASTAPGSVTVNTSYPLIAGPAV